MFLDIETIEKPVLKRQLVSFEILHKLSQKLNPKSLWFEEDDNFKTRVPLQEAPRINDDQYFVYSIMDFHGQNRLFYVATFNMKTGRINPLNNHDYFKSLEDAEQYIKTETDHLYIICNIFNNKRE